MGGASPSRIHRDSQFKEKLMTHIDLEHAEEMEYRRMSDQVSAKPQPTFDPVKGTGEVLGTLVANARGMVYALGHHLQFLQKMQDHTTDPFKKGEIQSHIEILQFEITQLRESVAQYDEWQKPPF
jgi:alpha-acetolactate decarboxylase